MKRINDARATLNKEFPVFIKKSDVKYMQAIDKTISMNTKALFFINFLFNCKVLNIESNQLPYNKKRHSH